MKKNNNTKLTQSPANNSTKKNGDNRALSAKNINQNNSKQPINTNSNLVNTPSINKLSGVKILKLCQWYIPAILMLTLGGYIYFMRVYSVYDFTLDDSFITYRYSKHLAEGAGIIWNLGENPAVEGYTTFLWVIINAIFIFLGLDPEQFSKYLSLFSVFILVIIISITPIAINKWLKDEERFSKRDDINFYKIFCVGSFIASIFFVMPEIPSHSISGMETMFAGLLLFVFALNLAYIDIVPQKYRIPITISVALACGLIRPEFNAGVFLGLITLWFIWQFWRKEKNLAREILIATSAYVVLGAIFFLWRYYYYGLLFPLPFYIKQLEPSNILFKGLVIMKQFQYQYWPFMLLALIGVAINLKRLLPPFILGLAVYVYFYFPEHIMGIYSRFIFPVMPIILWLAGNAIHKAVRINFIPSVIWSLGMFLLVVNFAYGDEDPKKPRPSEIKYIHLYDYNWMRNLAWLTDYNHSEHRSLIPLGKALAKDLQTNPQKLKIAMVDLGAVAYYGDWEMIDLFGLTHPKLAIARSRGNYNADMLLQESPDIVLLGEFFREQNYRGQFAFESDLYYRMSSYNYYSIARFQWNSVFGFIVFAKDEKIAQRFNSILSSDAIIGKTFRDLRK